MLMLGKHTQGYMGTFLLSSQFFSVNLKLFLKHKVLKKATNDKINERGK